jgi:predicted RNA binding protein YcfA (HicA-like mRNA interferase family)
MARGEWRAALRLLEQEGYVLVRRGKGCHMVFRNIHGQQVTFSRNMGSWRSLKNLERTINAHRREIKALQAEDARRLRE